MKVAGRIKQNQDKNEMLQRSLERIVQLYTDKSHFIYELLQNAEDAGASTIRFEQYEDRLEVMHDGHPFTVENLQGLCDIGRSDKINDLTQIGEFGVGFKSVFGICEVVNLYSMPAAYRGEGKYEPFAVRIEGFVDPVDITPLLDYDYTTKFVFPYAVGKSFSGFKTLNELNEKIGQRLENLESTTLLFMKNLGCIEYVIHRDNQLIKGNYYLRKEILNDHCAKVNAYSGTNDISDISYLIFSKPVSTEIYSRSIDIAFPYRQSDKGAIEFIKPKTSPFISVFFPTETESKLNFIVQGPYRTTPNRSSVPQDDDDNLELADATAEFFKECILEMRNMGIVDLSLLSILPFDEDVFDAMPLFSPLYDATVELLSEEKILPIKDAKKTYGFAENAFIARSSELADIVDNDLLTELVNDGEEHYWLPTTLTETNKTLSGLHRFLTTELDIDILRPESLREYFNENHEFLKKRDNDWLVRLYKLYETIGYAFDRSKIGSSMLTADFIKTQKGNFVSALKRDSMGKYSPNVFLPSKEVEHDFSGELLDNDIFSRCPRLFLDIIQLEEPDLFDYYITNAKIRYQSDAPISEYVHAQDIKSLCSFLDNPATFDTALAFLKSDFKLRVKLYGEALYVNPYTHSIYFKQSETGVNYEEYFRYVRVGGNNVYFIDYDFYQEHGITRENLRDVGVVDTIITGDDRTSGYDKGSWESKGTFRYEFSLINVNDVLKYIQEHPGDMNSIIKSQVIFKTLQENEEKLSGTIVKKGQSSREVSMIIEVLGGPGNRLYATPISWVGKWLYTEKTKLVSQHDISKAELNQAIYGPVNVTSKLYSLLGFMKSEEDKLEDTKEEFDSYSDEKKTDLLRLALEERYGITPELLDKVYGSREKPKGEQLREFYAFPRGRVRNWDNLRRHVAQVLAYSSDVMYVERLRRVRPSKDAKSNRAYLMSQYKAEGVPKYICQICQGAFENFEAVQLEDKPKKEIDEFYLCLCPDCATAYRNKKKNEKLITPFINEIAELTRYKIEETAPFSIEFDGLTIHFTQTHIAEINEIMSLMSEVEEKSTKPAKKEEPLPNPPDSQEERDKEEEPDSGNDYLQGYIGKKVFHKPLNKSGTIISIRESGSFHFITIEFDDSVKKEYKLEQCLSNKWLEFED